MPDNITPEIRFNRQINYTVIRKLWDAIKGGFGNKLLRCYPDDKDSFANMFELSISKLNQLTSGYIGKIGMKSYSDSIAQKSGISREILYGTRPYMLPDISLEEWKNYFDRKEKYLLIKHKYSADMQKYKQAGHDEDVTAPITKRPQKPSELSKFEKKIYGTLKVYDREKDVAQSDLFYTHYYIEVGESYYKQSSASKIIRLSNGLKDVTIADLEAAKLGDIKSYYNSLTAQQLMVKTILAYRRYKGK